MQLNYTDKDLFTLIADGDEVAFAELFRRYDKRIFPFTLKMIKSHAQAEEITQEIFIKLWSNRQKLIDIDHPEAYIFTVASRHTLDHIKKLRTQEKRMRSLSSRLTETSNATEETILYRESASLINAAVETLPDQQKKIYQLSRNQGYTNNEIAEMLNLSPNTIRNHLAAALRTIRKFITEKGRTTLSSVIVFFF